MLAAVTADPSALDRVANVSGFARRLLDSRQAEAAVLLELALARGADLPTHAVDVVCFAGHIDSLALLLRRGFPATSAAMIFAAEEGNVAKIELLLAHGCPVNVELGESPFLRAVASGHLDAAHRLVAAGANVAHQTSDCNALHFAAQSDKADEMIEFVLGLGADVDVNAMGLLGERRCSQWSEM